MIDVKKYPLGAQEAHDLHNNIIITDKSYSLTITLNPRYNILPVHEQHRKFTKDITDVMKGLSHYYNEMLITPEFTKDYNIHYHCYFKLPCETEDHIIFEQNYKRLIKGRQSIGFMYKLKKIDSVTEELKGYPFKDIQRTIKYSQIENCLFKPRHIFFQGAKATIKESKSKPSGSIDIIKFIDFINKNNLVNL